MLSGRRGAGALKAGALALCGDLELPSGDEGLSLECVEISSATSFRLSIGLTPKVVALGLIVYVLIRRASGRRKKV